MSGHTARHSTRPITLCRFLVLCLPILVVGCAQMQQHMQQPGYYNPPAASSATDAVEYAEAPTGSQAIRAPSQIQIGLKNRPSDAAPVQGQASGSAPAAAHTKQSATAENDSLQATLFPKPQTFAGTLPCFHPEMKCSAQRITLTLAPNGRWRARAAYLEQANNSGSPLADQGCWRVIPHTIPKIVLLNPAGNVRAELALSSSNVLRLVSISGDSPNLTYTLTRQPDLDPIAELNKVVAPNCP